MIDVGKNSRILLVALAASAILQCPFLLLVLSGPHYGERIGLAFFSPTLHLMDHLSPVLSLKFFDSESSEVAVLAQMFLIQVALLAVLFFPLVVVFKWLRATLSDKLRLILLDALVSCAVAVLSFPFLLVLMFVTGPNGWGAVLAEPSFYLVNHMPPPFNFGSEGPAHSDFGKFIEFFLFQVVLSTVVVFAFVFSFKWLLQHSIDTRRKST